MIIGKRKLIVALVYLALAPAMVWVTGDTEGIAAIMVSLATGVAAFVWGNSHEHTTDPTAPDQP